MTPYACGGKTSIEKAEMKQDITIESKEEKELPVEDMFEMDAIFENEKKKLKAPKNTRIPEINRDKEIVIDRSRTANFLHNPGKIEHSEENMKERVIEAARLQEARDVLVRKERETERKKKNQMYKMNQAKIDFFPDRKIPSKEVKCSQDNEEKTEQQKIKDKEEEIQLNQELAKAFLKQAEIAQKK